MRTVKFLRTHSSMNIPGLGELGNALPPGNKTFDKLQMFSAPQGVEVQVKPRAGVERTIIIPWGAISVAELGPEPQPESKQFVAETTLVGSSGAVTLAATTESKPADHVPTAKPAQAPVGGIAPANAPTPVFRGAKSVKKALEEKPLLPMSAFATAPKK